MTDEREHIHALEETRQEDIAAMLTAILLIERGQAAAAVEALIARLPVRIAVPLKAGK